MQDTVADRALDLALGRAEELANVLEFVRQHTDYGTDNYVRVVTARDNARAAQRIIENIVRTREETAK